MSEKFPPAESEKHEVIGEVGVVEDIGKRKTMEDAHTIERRLGGRKDRHFFAIYDGHSGREGADLAVEKLHQYLLLNLGDSDPAEALDRAFRVTDGLIEASSRAGAAVVVAFFEADKLWIANAGDARAVIVREGGVERLSHDHKPNDPAEKARIEKAGGKVRRFELYELAGKTGGVDEDDEARKMFIKASGGKFLNKKDVYRVGRHAMSRSVGDRENKLVIPDPEIREIEIRPGDRRLVLACDGIWDVITDTEAANLIREESDPQKAAEILKKEALEKGSQDNLSVIVINLTP